MITNLEKYDETRALLSLAQTGDQEAMINILDKYRFMKIHLLNQYGFTSGAGVLSWEDMDQQVSLFIIELVQEFNPKQGVYFGKYLKTKLDWRVHNFVRAEKNRTKRTYAMDPIELNVKLDNFPSETEQDKFEKEISEIDLGYLSSKQRQAFLLTRVYDQLSTVVANQIGITPRSVIRLADQASKKLAANYVA